LTPVRDPLLIDGMDPFAPIQGISLERYADLCVAMKDTGGDADQCAAIAQQHGVSPADWVAAQQGWNARMADPALAGRVALAYMPIYQAALAKSGPAATATYREYVSMMACLGVFGIEQMYARCAVDGVRWSQIATYWSNQLVQHQAQYPGYGDDLLAEKERLSAGGAPLRLGEDQQGARADAGDLAAAASAIVATQFKPGDAVLVSWSDGNKYPGQVVESQGDRALIGFQGSEPQWIETRWIEKAR
jgi:hypothetical protein